MCVLSFFDYQSERLCSWSWMSQYLHRLQGSAPGLTVYLDVFDGVTQETGEVEEISMQGSEEDNNV